MARSPLATLALTACICLLLLHSADAWGRPRQRPGKFYKQIEARLSGKNLEGGEARGRGHVRFAIFKQSDTYNVFYDAAAKLSDKPTTLTIYGPAGNGSVCDGGVNCTSPSTLAAAAGDADVALLEFSKWNKKPKLAGFFLRLLLTYLKPGYTPRAKYWLRNMLKDTNSQTALNGQTVTEVFDAMIDDPTGYYAVVKSGKYPDGAIKGDLRVRKCHRGRRHGGRC